MKSQKTVEDYVSAYPRWKEELAVLVKAARSVHLEESIKWGAPVYSADGKNIAGLAAFKSHIAIWFFQGALLEDKKKLLVNAQEGRTKALRQMRFQAAEEIDEKTIVAYLREAIRNQKEGKEIKPEKNKPLEIHPDMQRVFDAQAEVKQCFDALTLTKKREYAEYIVTAKREETRVSRLEKIIPMILEQKGMNDRYRS